MGKENKMEKKRVLFGVCLTILLVFLGLSLFEVFAATTTITDVSSAASTLLIPEQIFKYYEV